MTHQPSSITKHRPLIYHHPSFIIHHILPNHQSLFLVNHPSTINCQQLSITYQCGGPSRSLLNQIFINRHQLSVTYLQSLITQHPHHLQMSLINCQQSIINHLHLSIILPASHFTHHFRLFATHQWQINDHPSMGHHSFPMNLSLTILQLLPSTNLSSLHTNNWLPITNWISQIIINRQPSLINFN